jgi:hypothetical protein
MGGGKVQEWGTITVLCANALSIRGQTTAQIAVQEWMVMGMDELNQQWFVPLEEKHEPFILIGGQRGGGKIFHLENRVKFLKEQLKQEKTETERWKSAALYYADKLGSGKNLEVVHAHWEDGCAVDHNGKEVYKSIDCSHCKEIFKIESHDREYWKRRFKVCPFCGAVMDGEKGNEDG